MTAKTRTAVEAVEAPKPITRQQRRRAAEVVAATEGRYDTGLRYGTFHYAVTDPVLPPAGTAKVKMELSTRSDTNLAGYGESHIAAITDNAIYPTPVPSPAVFAAGLAAFEADMTALDNHRLEGKSLTFKKDQSRKNFEFLFAQRGAYVQTASNSNVEAIASAGLMIRNAPTPVGVLPAPLGLRLELTQVNGEILVRWNTVTGARNYVLEYAEIFSGEALAWSQAGVCSKLVCLVKGLTQGKRFAFRVAAMGGADGQSAWSPVVERMAA